MSFIYPNPTPVFPNIPTSFPQSMRPTFNAAMTATTVNGNETRTIRQAFPIWEFEIVLERLKDQTQNLTNDGNGFKEFQAISGLFLACRGRYGRFYYSCPQDFSRSAAQIATGDGTTTQFIVYRNFLNFKEPVGGIESIQTVYLDGVPILATEYSYNGNLLTFNSAPANEVVISLDFSFYYLCRFLEDMQSYDQFYNHLWSQGSCRFESAKA